MSNYTICPGDNLWSIVKQQGGQNLKTAADIKKAVDLVALSNKEIIKNPDVLFVNTEIEIPDFSSIFNSQETIETSTSQNADIFSQYTDWQDAHADLMSQSIDIDEYNENKAALGISFDFMEGKDYNNETDYNAQTLKLGEGEVALKDSDNNGSVSFVEYFSEEIRDEIPKFQEMILKGEMTEQEAVDILKDVFIQANKVFNLIDQPRNEDGTGGMGGDGDGQLDAEEFQTYYQYLDKYKPSKDGVNEKDGKINIDYVSEYPEFLANQINIDSKTEQNAQKIISSLLSL